MIALKGGERRLVSPAPSARKPCVGARPERSFSGRDQGKWHRAGAARRVKQAPPRMSRIDAEARRLLLKRRESLHRSAADATRADPTASWVDWESVQEPISEVTRRELADIDDALRRIEEGRYGRCESCGGPMGLQRIRAIPEARFCLSCSGQREVSE